MKMILASVLLLASPSAFAADASCVKFLPCGTFDGPAMNIGADGKQDGEAFREQIILTPVNENTVHISEALYDSETKPGEGYALEGDFVFSEDGRYTMKSKSGKLFATGVCANNVCTFDFVPFVWKSEKGETGSTGNVEVLRFGNGTLERTMLATTKAGEYSIQRTQLTLKK